MFRFINLKIYHIHQKLGWPLRYQLFTKAVHIPTPDLVFRSEKNKRNQNWEVYIECIHSETVHIKFINIWKLFGPSVPFQKIFKKKVFFSPLYIPKVPILSHIFPIIKAMELRVALISCSKKPEASYMTPDFSPCMDYSVCSYLVPPVHIRSLYLTSLNFCLCLNVVSCLFGKYILRYWCGLFYFMIKSI